MQSYNDLSLNNSVLGKMLITPWSFNYHNDGNAWILLFGSLGRLTLSVVAVSCGVVAAQLRSRPATSEQTWEPAGSHFTQPTREAIEPRFSS